jgi:hypothetical protein
MTLDPQLDGKRALIEVREGRRWHRVVIATLRKEGESVFAVFREQYPQHRPEPAKVKIPEKQLGHFELVSHADYDLKFTSVLYRVDHQSEDTGAWVRPPIIVTQADIDAEKTKNGA